MTETIFHVTMSPSAGVVDKCAPNLPAGFRAILLAPRSEMDGARHFVKMSKAPTRIWGHSIEEFVGQNLAEIGEFGKEGFRSGMEALLEAYNARVQKVEPKRSLLIETPENL